MTLSCAGVGLLGQMIEKDLACARHLERLVLESDDFEMLAPVELSIFCFRYLPRRFKTALAEADQASQRRINEDLDVLNQRLLLALQQDGSSYLSNTRVHGRFSLRGCVLNYRTTPRDMEILLQDLRRMAGGLALKTERLPRPVASIILRSCECDSERREPIGRLSARKEIIT